MFGKRNKFRYSILCYDRQMASGRDNEPLGVVVLGEDRLFIMGRYPSNIAGLSDTGRVVLERLPDTLADTLRQGVEARTENLLDWLVAENQWSLHFTTPREAKASESLEQFAYELFNEEVLTPRSPAGWQEDLFMREFDPAAVGPAAGSPMAGVGGGW